MHGTSLVQSQGISPQASKPNGNAFEPIPTLYYLVRNNPRGVYHFLQDQNIPSDKNNTSLYNGVKNFVKHADQQQVLAFVQAIHPDKKYFDSPTSKPSNLDAKIDEWEKEKEKTNDPQVKSMLDELIAKAKDLAQQGKGTVEELISEFKGAKKDSDFYKQVSIIAIVVIILLIVTRK